MRNKILLLSSVALLLLSGCGSKQYYTPTSTQSTSTASSAEVTNFSRDAATLNDGRVLSQAGELKLKLEKGYSLINHVSNIAITANKKGACRLIAPNGNTKDIQLPQALVAGTMIKGQLIYLLQNNTYGIYDLAKKSIVYSGKAQKALSIDIRVANPLQVDNLVVIPTLSGKLIVLDLTTHKIAKEIYVSTETTLNNIIFLGRLNNTLVAATPHAVISVSTKGKREYKRAISEVVIDNNELFVFSKDGQVAQLDESLTVLSEKKFKFAHFSVAGSTQDKLFALDKQGYLIVSNKNFTKHKVYQIDEVEGYGFVSAGKIYYDGNVVDINSLSYE